jgi:transposase
MNASIMHKAFGVSKQDCLDMHYEDNNIIIKIQTRKEELCCPRCGSHHVVNNGSTVRRFLSVPIGHSKTYLEMRVQRIKCRDCDCVCQEDIDFAKGKRRHTQFFANMVIDLSRFATIQDIAWFLDVSWDVVRNIQMEFLQKNYGTPNLSELRLIGIDEFAMHKGQIYKTIVLDLETGRIVYVGDGNGKSALDEFWKLLGDKNENIKAVCTDLSSAFTNSVVKHLPNASLVVDHFHVQKLMNEKIDTLRRQMVHMEKDVNKRKVIKGTRWLLLKNGADIFDNVSKNRLDNVLKLNEPLTAAYYLKEDLREIWNQCRKSDAEKVLDEWVQQALDAKVQPLTVMAKTLRAHKPYILAWYDYPLSNGPVEGTNNKIKVLKRQAYGYRNEEFFTLKLYALHDKRLRI